MTQSIRCHHYQFAHIALRSVAFAEPIRLLALLATAEAQGAFASLLEQVVEECKERGETIDFDASALGLHLRRVAGNPCAVVEMPPPRATGEAHYTASMLRMGEGPDDVALRYFTLDYSAADESPPSTLLGEWQADGTHVNHGPGPDPSVEGFLRAILAVVAKPI